MEIPHILPFPTNLHLTPPSTSHTTWSNQWTYKGMLLSFKVHSYIRVHSWCCISYCFSVAKSCPTLGDSMDCSTPGFPVFHYLRNLLKLISIKIMMPYKRIILCHPFSYHRSFPASGSFPRSHLFASGGQSWFPLGLTGLISLLSKYILWVLTNI